MTGAGATSIQEREPLTSLAIEFCSKVAVVVCIQAKLLAIFVPLHQSTEEERQILELKKKIFLPRGFCFSSIEMLRSFYNVANNQTVGGGVRVHVDNVQNKRLKTWEVSEI